VRAVIDTNVLVSGLIWRGPPHTVLECVRTGSIDFVSSPALLAELSEVLARDKFRTHLLRVNIDVDQIIESVFALAARRTQARENAPGPGPRRRG
jgi:putative PIN family toxin of toxin-antitoxin system